MAKLPVQLFTDRGFGWSTVTPDRQPGPGSRVLTFEGSKVIEGGGQGISLTLSSLAPLPGETVTATLTLPAGATLTSVTATVGGAAVTLSGTGLTRTFTIPAGSAEGATISVMAAATLDGKTISGSAAAAVGHGAVEPVTPLTAIGAEGWDATYPSPPASFAPDTAPETVVVQRAGFDGTGAAVSRADTLTVTKRVRNPYPDTGTLTADRVALSDVIYAADAIAGAVNNSAVVSPKPICNWAHPDRILVGNTMPREYLGVVAFHRDACNGEEVACVEWTISDGAASVVVRQSVSEIAAHPGDLYPVIAYLPPANVDISSLADNVALTVNAKVYPHFGIGNSVRNSADASNRWEFSPRKFSRSTARAAAPYYAYVATGGTSSGTVSTDPSVAAAAPFDSIYNAVLQANAANGHLEHLVVRLTAGAWAFVSMGSPTKVQEKSSIVIERAPGVAFDDVTLNMTAGSNRSLNIGASEGWFQLKQLRVSRTGTGTIGHTLTSGQVLVLWFDRCQLDLGAYNSALFGNSTCKVVATGLSLTASAGYVAIMGTASAYGPIWRLMRGVSAVTGSFDSWLTLGSRLLGRSDVQLYALSYTQSGTIAAFNRFQHTDTLFGFAASGVADGVALVQNLIEYTQATVTPSIRFSSDDASGSSVHLVMHHNTLTGYFSGGRGNLFYDEGSTERSNKLMSMKGNIHCQINNKGDSFVKDGTRLGNWQYYYGAGCEGEFSQFIDAEGNGGFKQAFPGLRASIGASSSVRNDPLFVDYRGTYHNGTAITAGVGGGDYQLMPGSPAKERVRPLLKWDLAGAPRTGALHDAGAYEAAA